jgi:hypothetical protein
MNEELDQERTNTGSVRKYLKSEGSYNVWLDREFLGNFDASQTERLYQGLLNAMRLRVKIQTHLLELAAEGHGNKE